MAERSTSPLSTGSLHSVVNAHAGKELGSRTSSASPPTSTPPTSLGDEASILSEAGKMEVIETREEVSTPHAVPTSPAVSQSAPEAPDSAPRRAIRQTRQKVVTYNVQILAGTSIHTPTKYLEKHHETVVHGDIQEVTRKTTPTPPNKRVGKRRTKSESAELADPADQQLATEAAQAAQRRTSSRLNTDLRRVALGNSGGVANTLSAGKNPVQSALKRSASDSRLRSSFRSRPSKFKEDTSEDEDEEEEEEEEEGKEPEYFKPKTKQWLKQGLYVGQERGFDARFTEKRNRARREARLAKENKVLPLPLFATEIQLESNPRLVFKPFKLPFDVYNPLPKKVKVDGWVKLNKNRFIGDASALWRREKHDDTARCFCKPEDGCGETCHNRIMAYECDATNCPLTPDQCNNRPFAQLKKRAKGNGYDYGVEVMETEGKGYGVRAMRCFEPHQIIVEYAGEIITQDECERRMKQVYKKDKCYYLMSFDNKMIIDATRGTIARFVNHSCEPNCEMIKWTVGGEPRMALFAGSRGIMTGEELTYDYNFDPFSLKNIQECRCGTKSCRGVLGPKPKKPANHEERSLPSALLAGAKRKLQDVFGGGRGSESAPNSPKKRMIGNSAMTKARNALAMSEAAREKAQREAAAHAAQIASRENRAMLRHKALATSKRGRLLHKASNAARPTVRTSKKTVINLKRKVTVPKAASKPGALKPVKNMPSKMVRGSKLSKGALLMARYRSATPEESSEDESPNITPASLRSANKKASGKKNSIKPLRLSKVGKLGQRTFEVSDSEEETDSDSEEEEIPDSEVDGEYGSDVTSSRFKDKKRGSAPAPRGIHKTGAGVAKNPRGRVRNAKGRFESKAKA
ncbi:SET domain-containing protein [Bimuria novae-zelandiae CBS 107.79]|uniref:SET domain-containing protein n=1 Tax=Bimuria novae-zelandiae CBS 107.79 TaxID=1447943 RepID=A0A6A5USN1_9PLEO|nr:SET domain-containing protein [Bimuria novae-zelandiae CBS 107.79]